jgi:hypothetical protein
MVLFNEEDILLIARAVSDSALCDRASTVKCGAINARHNQTNFLKRYFGPVYESATTRSCGLPDVSVYRSLSA